MYDTFLKAQAAAMHSDFHLDRYGVSSGDFVLATLHREETTTSAGVLHTVLNTLGDLGRPVLLPMHPRTRACLNAENIPLERNDGLKILEPVSYLEMVFLLHHASMVLTDSGGLQKEAFWANVPCVTLMQETTWPETLDTGWNTLAGLDPTAIRSAVKNFSDRPPVTSGELPMPYGASGAAQRMVQVLGWA